MKRLSNFTPQVELMYSPSFEEPLESRIYGVPPRLKEMRGRRPRMPPRADNKWPRRLKFVRTGAGAARLASRRRHQRFRWSVVWVALLATGVCLPGVTDMSRRGCRVPPMGASNSAEDREWINFGLALLIK
ncbi:unnamed protein product [Nesidiocoris tenuis]|uniref:Uncharacterized protein n=1 Tax=Nesidiocoris tenuis TaxID=355587 RepID=A0A6H5H7G0_9HEMI|nr:unnamed protein product [Nesidiocoris tenuis]